MAERASRPRPLATPTEDRTREAHRRDNHASTQKTAEEPPDRAPTTIGQQPTSPASGIMPVKNYVLPFHPFL